MELKARKKFMIVMYLMLICIYICIYICRWEDISDYLLSDNISIRRVCMYTGVYNIICVATYVMFCIIIFH